MSCSSADLSVTGVEEICRWVTLREYIELSGKTLNEVKKKIDANQLGRLEKCPELDEILIIYTEKFHNLPINKSTS